MLPPFSSIVLMKDGVASAVNATLNFNGTNEVTAVKLEWEADDESNTDFYRLERSTDGSNFELVSNFLATKKPAYSFLDPNPAEGKNIYRLKQVSYAGDTLSKLAVVSFNSTKRKLELFPNPVLNTLRISSDVSLNGPAYIQVQSVAGNLVLTSQVIITNGYTTIDLSQLKAGAYTITVNTSNQKFTEKLIKQ